MIRWLCTTSAAVLLLMTSGCPPQRNYHIKLANHSPMMLTKATVRLGTFTMPPGLLAPGTSRTFLFVGDEHRLAEEATVRWVGPDGRTFIRSMTVKQKILREVALPTIIFIIEANNEVTVTVAEM